MPLDALLLNAQCLQKSAPSRAAAPSVLPLPQVRAHAFHPACALLFQSAAGCYPPDLNETEELDSAMLTPLGGSFDLASAGSCLAHSGGSGSVPGSQQLRAHSAGPGRLHRAPSRRRLAAYTPVVHCGSIRQAAQVVAMRELPAAGAAPAPAGGTGGCVGGFGSQQCGGFPSQLEELEDVLTGLELSGELCGASQAAPQPATQHSTPASYARELAGAMAAAGVLQHTPLAAAATPSSSAPSTAAPGASSASGAGSSGHASSGEATPASTPATPAPTPVAAGGSSCEGASGLQLLAALERERTAAAADNIGCVAAVTFCFMHQPGVWLGACGWEGSAWRCLQQCGSRCLSTDAFVEPAACLPACLPACLILRLQSNLAVAGVQSGWCRAPA